MPKKTVWLSYDLAFDSSYDDLYAWLDGMNAKECGNSIATFTYEYVQGDFIEGLRSSLMQHVRPSVKDRYYVVYFDGLKKKMSGKYIFGARRKAPWAGYHQLAEDIEDVASEEAV